VRQWRRWLAVLAVAALLIGVVTVVEMFSLAAESQPYGKAQAHNQYQPVYASLVRLLLGGWNWLRERLDHDTLSTLAIVATACFTGTLWGSTRLLWKTSETHSRHLEQSVGAAKASADAANAHAIAAAEANAINREILVASNRPWIAITEIYPGGPIYMDENGMIIDLAVNMKNIGRSPARDVYLACQIYPRIMPDLYGMDKMKTACQNVRQQAVNSANLVGGDALFPEQDTGIKIRIMVPKTRLKINPTSEYPGTILTPIVIGCIDYRFMTSDSVHYHTGFSMLLAYRQSRGKPADRRQ
jgi:hypothetical protein